MTTEEQQVAQFCKLILDNLNGNIRCSWFCLDVGLCNNYDVWTNKIMVESRPLKRIIGWNDEYPFGDYHRNGESIKGTIYENAERLNFIREWASKA
jgi:hypothetical protein